jgi:hypothetical protein
MYFLNILLLINFLIGLPHSIFAVVNWVHRIIMIMVWEPSEVL